MVRENITMLKVPHMRDGHKFTYGLVEIRENIIDLPGYSKFLK